VNRRWWLALIATPAAVAIWSGWVGLGGLCGFGPVRLLPGFTDWTLNTAITLPVGVEAYAAFALGAWISDSGDISDTARTFAKWSALGALAYGMLGQVTYHLLAARGYTVAPWPVVVVVSCMPVAVLGFAAALAHLLGDGRGRGEAQEGDDSNRSPATTQPVEDAGGRPPWARLDADLLAHLAHASLRSTADSFGVSKTRVETAKRRASLTPAEESPAGPPQVSPAGASGRDAGLVPPHPSVPAAQSSNGHHA